MIGLITSVLPSLLKIGDKMIEDKDQKAEYAFKVQEIAFKQMETMLNAKTYPFVDALVKLSYASEQIVKGLFRPLGSAAMTGFLFYAEIYNIELSGAVEAVCAAAFPGWMASRYTEKKTKAKKENFDPFEED